jgi:hypothetical protein
MGKLSSNSSTKAIQQPLYAAPTKGKTNAARALGYDEANLRSAREILADVERHGGAEAFPAAWARAVIERLGGAE